MRTTSIKDVTTVLSPEMPNSIKAASETAQVSFQSVWNHQTTQNSFESEKENSTVDTKKVNPQEEARKAQETVRKPVKETEKPKAENTELTEEQTQEAMEVLGTAATDMMQQVADAFGMTVEELSLTMEAMNMTTLDILNPEQLSALLLKLSGAQDTMALLMNEEMYADFKQLMDAQQTLLSEVGNELQLSKEQLAQMLNEAKKQFEGMLLGAEDVADMTEQPVVEVTVETADTTEEAMQNQKNNVVNPETVQQEVETGIKVQETANGAKAGDGKEHSAGNSGEQTGNLLLQNLKLDGMQPEVAQVQTGAAWEADTQDIMRQIMDYMKIQIKPGVSDVEMQLHPENLGTLQIHVSSKGGVVTANFITQNEAVKAALESQMVQLKENFAEQGVKVEAIEVSVQTQEFNRNLEQGRGSHQEEPEKKNRTRRINLNELSGLEEAEELSQEDNLVAEMMTANGNTVDYTA
ncbi:MAG: flagellar hook-length control protein FliK [Lachnospiraceae bacterium]|nr:flagellar hook-length control protein FliK [Lachnospiraceae bacterium]